MPRSPKVLYVLADGGRARLVERVTETGAFRTVRELDGTARLAELRRAVRSTPGVRSVQSGTGVGHTTGIEDPYRAAKADFAGEVAQAAAAHARKAGIDGLVLVGPARVLATLRLAAGPGLPVLGSLAKDLTKVPDPDLPAWLTPLAQVAAKGRNRLGPA